MERTGIEPVTPGLQNPLITLRRYSHLLDTRIMEAAYRFDPARVT
jgi:hypothetical protein